MKNEQCKTRVGLCETQPVTAEGIRSLLGSTPDLECRWCAGSLAMAVAMLQQQPVEVLLIDKSFLLAPNQELAEILEGPAQTLNLVVWGQTLSELEALRFAQGGARGVLRKTTDLPAVLRCLRAVAAGTTWMEETGTREPARLERTMRSSLTARERQVLELVEQGMRNKEIADVLRIRPGTVKIHMKHIFEKTGVRGRYGLALNGLRQKGLLALSRAHGLVNGAESEAMENEEARALKAS